MGRSLSSVAVRRLELGPTPSLRPKLKHAKSCQLHSPRPTAGTTCHIKSPCVFHDMPVAIFLCKSRRRDKLCAEARGKVSVPQ